MAPTYLVGSRDRIFTGCRGSHSIISFKPCDSSRTGTSLIIRLKIWGAWLIDSRETKRLLREEALARRDALPMELRIDRAWLMAGFAGDIHFDPGTIISGFLPIRSEVDARPIMAELRKRGAQLCLPAVTTKTEIIFRAFDRQVELVPAGFGTFAPPKDAAILEPQILLVPLSAFDARGHRIGYGAGHYDRAIAKLIDKGTTPRLIGLGFDCQRVGHVLDEAHDVPLEAIITETGLHRFPLKG
jgi:5-formyltetrahydrofolate cyclo-ligase